MIRVTVSDIDKIQDDIKKALRDFMPDKHVTIGIHEEAGNVESSELTMASLGAIHEFGANINHPGGTSYGYATQKAAENGQVRFLKTGTGFMQLGVTGPHQINIPARPWLEPGVKSGNEEYLKSIDEGITAGKTPDQILELLGVIAVGKTQKYMTDLQDPPNAPSTIAKKGSSNPLIHNGEMRQSVTYKVQDGKTLPTEGIE